MTRTVLFLCTGNYYRSRFVELFFNSLASRSDLEWMAISRGIATELGARNVGPISPHALDRLRALGVKVEQEIRYPLQLEEQDLGPHPGLRGAQADLIVALNETEHRTYLSTRFPKWVDRVEYWHIADLDTTPADEALLQMEREVRSLIKRLGPS